MSISLYFQIACACWLGILLFSIFDNVFVFVLSCIEKCITIYNDKKKEKDLKSRGANNIKVKNGKIYEMEQ